MTTSNAYDAPQRDGLPDTWLEALDLFAESPFIGRWLGEEYRHVYAETKRYERRVFEGHIRRWNGRGIDEPVTAALDLCQGDAAARLREPPAGDQAG